MISLFDIINSICVVLGVMKDRIRMWMFIKGEKKKKRVIFYYLWKENGD